MNRFPTDFSAVSNAHAKLNLDLYILSKREDGFHDLSTVMLPLPFSDRVTLRISPSDRFSVQSVTFPNLIVGENIAEKAVKSYLAAIGESNIAALFHIEIEKHIPVSAGLGGGSADAAAVLRLMNAAFSDALSESELSAVALSIGSDVPFCLYGNAARCYSRGEDMRPLRVGKPLFIVLYPMSFPVSTKEAFAAADRVYRYDSASVAQEEMLEAALSEGDLGKMAKSRHNMFEDVIFEMHPEAKTALDKLLLQDAAFGGMSGSGPTLFAVYDSAEKAEKAAEAIGAPAVSLTIPAKEI